EMFSRRRCCRAPCAVSCPEPLACAWSRPCLTSCGDSRALIQPPPVLLTFPGPILASCPQESLVAILGKCSGSLESLVASSTPSGNFLGSGNFPGSTGSYGSRSFGNSCSSYGSSGFGSRSFGPC
ncbi:KRFA protein, partial [Erythrocercus mccallii]|nr:KRFA protein [Erythrocercus mccallii]